MPSRNGDCWSEPKLLPPLANCPVRFPPTSIAPEYRTPGASAMASPRLRDVGIVSSSSWLRFELTVVVVTSMTGLWPTTWTLR